jgi:hypothetical protein
MVEKADPTNYDLVGKPTPATIKNLKDRMPANLKNHKLLPPK